MPISQTTITGSVKTPDNSDAQITEISFKLTGSDYEAGELIAVNTTFGSVTTAAGDFTVDLWPNDMGMEGNTKYTVTAKFSDGSSIPGLKDIYVKYSDTPKTIEDVAFETKAAGAIKPMALVVLTQAQYDALATKSPTTAYLIRA
tara:strand:+ start:982 stop:1416 length:435 start_codon:yes stop_codon:yes gene_type:complete